MLIDWLDWIRASFKSESFRVPLLFYDSKQNIFGTFKDVIFSFGRQRWRGFFSPFSDIL